MRRTVLGVLAAAALPLAAQGPAEEFAEWRTSQLEDLRLLKDKFLSLAEAVPDAQWSWRPMDGTRSFHEVYAHIAAEGMLEPLAFGRPLLEGSLRRFGDEEQRLAAMSRADLRAATERALDNLIATFEAITYESSQRPMRFFGTDTHARGAVAASLGDLHEHLGQLIAYARMHRIVPPWSRGGE